MNDVYATVKLQLNNNDGLDLYKEQSECLKNLLERFIEFGESGSSVILGPHGAGKSSLVKSACKQYKDNLALVELNGLFHNDEKAVINEIGSQLNVTVDLEDETVSISDNLQRILLSSAKRRGKRSKPYRVVFVLEEFDRFTYSAHQNFLYNILDKSASQQSDDEISIFVICISVQINVMELLEKRVRSRLSQKQLLLFNNWSFDEYVEFVKQLLTVKSTKHSSQIKEWNNCIKVNLKSDPVRKTLKTLYSQNKSLRSLKQFLLLVVKSAMLNCDCIEPKVFVKVAEMLRVPDDYLLKDLSILEICILLAAKCYIDKMGDDETLNFECIYQEYRRFAQKHCRTILFPKDVVKKAFDKLEEYEIFVSKNENTGKNFVDEFRLVRFQLDGHLLTDFVKKLDCPDVVKHYASNRFSL